MATAALSTKSVGSIVKIKISGTLRDFIVVHQGKPSISISESRNTLALRPFAPLLTVMLVPEPGR